MGIIKRGLKNAFRNSIRTFLIVVILGLSIGLVLIMLVARQAVQAKIESVKSSIGNTVSVSPAGMRGFEGGGEPLTEDKIGKLQKLEHVTSVTKILNDRLTTENSNLVTSIDAGSLGRRFSENSGQRFAFPFGENRSGSGSQGIRTFTPPITLVGTTQPTNLSSSIGGGTFKLIDGEVFGSSSSDNVALIGSSLASKNNLKVGLTFTAYSTTIKVIGIFDAGNNFSNNQVIMPIAIVQKLTNQTSSISAVNVIVDSISNIDSVTTAINNELKDKADVTNSADQAKETLTPLENIKNISTVSLIGSLIVCAFIILLTMMMIVRERRREIGVLKAIGATNIRVMGQFIVESLTLTLLGMVIGIGIGFFASNSVTQLLVRNSVSSNQTPGIRGGGMMRMFGQGINSIRDVQASIGWDIILYGFGAAIIIAILGSAIPAWFISKVRPAEVMRSE